MKINRYKGLALFLTLFFVLPCAIVVYMTLFAGVFAYGISGADLFKNERVYIDQENIDPVLAEGGIVEEGKNKNLLSGDPFRYQLSQNDRGEDSADNVNEEKPGGAEEQIGDKGKGSGMVFEPIQYCQGKFKRLGGGAVEIITVRCPKADDTCNCEVDKKSPTKWVECGGDRKDSTVGSDLLSCESKIVGSSAAANSE